MLKCRYNPSTLPRGETIKTYEALDKAQIETALGEAETAFESWRKTDLEERAALVRRLADTLEKTAKQSARTMTLEMGKTLASGRSGN